MKEREREMGERKENISFNDFMGFCRSELGMPRVKAALRDVELRVGTGITRFRQCPRFDFSRKPRKRQCPRKSR